MIYHLKNYQQNNLVILGIKHSGKSTLGKRLGQDLNCDFYDLDEYILKMHNHFASVRELYQARGKKYFQKMEKKILKFFYKKFAQQEGNILALGGGTIENRAQIKMIKKRATLIYLYNEPQALFERIIAGGLPPFVNKENPYRDFCKIFEKRDKMCKYFADFVLYINNLSVDDAFKSLKDLVVRQQLMKI